MTLHVFYLEYVFFMSTHDTSHPRSMCTKVAQSTEARQWRPPPPQVDKKRKARQKLVRLQRPNRLQVTNAQEVLSLRTLIYLPLSSTTIRKSINQTVLLYRALVTTQRCNVRNWCRGCKPRSWLRGPVSGTLYAFF